MSSQDQGRFDVQFVMARVKELLGSELREVCSSEGLAVSGVKASQQARIQAQLQDLARSNQAQRYDRLKQQIYGFRPMMGFHAGTRSGQRTSESTMNPAHPAAAKNGSRPQNTPSSNARGPSRITHLNFKRSPFHTIVESLTPVKEIPIMPSNRYSVDTELNLRSTVRERLKADPMLRIMVYGAADHSLGAYTLLDIAFPHQVELRVNKADVKANLRGLKNKPGSTRPADITDYLKKKHEFRNEIQLCYALTQKKFHYVVNLVKTHPVEELVGKLKGGNVISKERVIREMVAKAQDLDIVATSTVMSLKCPLSTLRMELPCRSTVCSHVQCFDAASFLQLQQQAPTWMCPICNKSISFEALAVDQYVGDILKSVNQNVDQVTIEPDGKWAEGVTQSTPSKPQNNNSTAVTHTFSDDDDDLIEIPDIRISTLKSEAANTSQLNRTPSNGHPRASGSSPSARRSASTAGTPSATPRNPVSSKRPASQVIDLTLSDSDEDVVPPPKRHQYGHPLHPSNSTAGLTNGHLPHRLGSMSGSESPVFRRSSLSSSRI